VNFMSNPDEKTAVDQFGKGDKYFGVATLLATMPGLPMIGHGQIEGFAEKYGMEYRRAYRDEVADSWLVERHEREIFPLLHRRWLFADVREFLLYDFYDPGGWVNEDVFAYSNRVGDERGLVVYHNRFAEAKGWIKNSAGYSVPDGSGGRRQVQRSLGEGLGLHPEGDWFTLLREQRSGLEFIRSSADLCRDGFFVELHAYGCQVFLDIHEMADGPSGQLRRLAERLGGAGVPSIGAALRDMQLAPLHAAVRRLAESGSLRQLTEAGVARSGKLAKGKAESRAPKAAAPKAPTAAALRALIHDVEASVAGVLAAQVEVTAASGDVAEATAAFRLHAEAALRLPEAASAGRLCAGLAEPEAWVALFGHLVSEAMAAVAVSDGSVAAGPGAGAAGGSPIEDLQLSPVIANVFRELGLDEAAAWKLVALIRLLRRLPLPSSVAGIPAGDRAATMVRALLADEAVRPYIRVNAWEGVSWFHRESFEQILWWMLALDSLEAVADADLTEAALKARLAEADRLTAVLARAGEASGYQVDKLEAAAAEG
jgi:hypothetical protein